MSLGLFYNRYSSQGFSLASFGVVLETSPVSLGLHQLVCVWTSSLSSNSVAEEIQKFPVDTPLLLQELQGGPFSSWLLLSSAFIMTDQQDGENKKSPRFQPFISSYSRSWGTILLKPFPKDCPSPFSMTWGAAKWVRYDSAPTPTTLLVLVGTGVYSQTSHGALLSLPKLIDLGSLPDSNWRNAPFPRVFGLLSERVKCISLRKI